MNELKQQPIPAKLRRHCQACGGFHNSADLTWGKYAICDRCVDALVEAAKQLFSEDEDTVCDSPEKIEKALGGLLEGVDNG